MVTYAKNTKVPISRTKGQIESLLQKYGATSFYTGWNDHGAAVIGFSMRSRSVRFVMPSLDELADARSSKAQRDQIERAAWRGLLLLVKAKLEAVDSGFTVFEEEFLSHIVSSSGATVYERLRDQLSEAPSGPLLLPAGFGGSL